MKIESVSTSSEGSLNHVSERNAGWARMRVGMSLAALVTLAFACTTTRKTAPPPQTQPANEQGVASWYGQEFAGRTTANGEIFDPLLFTAAHRTLPFGTIVDVRNPKTNQTVRVRVNDRGPYIGNRTIDLSYAAAQQISLIDAGSGDIEMTVVRVGQGEHEPPAPYSVTIGNDTPAPSQIAASPNTVVVTPAPVSAPPPVVVDRVQVEPRKQVSPSGKSVSTVPAPQPVPSTSVAPQRTSPQPASPAPPPAPTSSSPAPVTPSPAPATPAPATPAPPTRVAPPTPSPTAGGRYVVQVGAFAQEPNAKILQDRLTRIGQQSHIDHSSLYFVRIGPFATREQAVQIRSKLETAGISAIVITPRAA